MNSHTLGIWQEKFEKYFLDNPPSDGGHDLGHFRRVWRLADKLSTDQEDKLILLAASYFHDIVSYPKNSLKRSESSKDAAVKAIRILSSMNFPKDKLDHVGRCIESHSFSANLKPETIEAKIIQDSDRLESLGAIGLARTFYVAGKMGSQLFESDDPFGKERKLDDGRYAIDHFEVKLLKLPEKMNTKTGKSEAEKRVRILKQFLLDLELELV